MLQEGTTSRAIRRSVSMEPRLKELVESSGPCTCCIQIYLMGKKGTSDVFSNR